MKNLLFAVLALVMFSCAKENNAPPAGITHLITDGEWLQDSAINNNQKTTYKTDSTYLTYQVKATQFIALKYKKNVLSDTADVIENCSIKGDSLCFNGKGSYKYTITGQVLKLERSTSGDTFWGHLK